ncbi:MAG: MFS transporter [Candidatus Nanopelagicus sp.]
MGALVQGTFLLRAGKFSDKNGRRAAYLFGSAFVLFGILMLAFTTNATLYFVAMAVFGLGGAYVGTAPGSVVGDIIRGRGGQVIAVWQMAGDAGMIFGPVIVGLITDLFSYQAAFLLSAGIWMVGILLATVLPETRIAHLDEDLIPDKNKQEL